MSDDRPVCNWPLDANGLVRVMDAVEPVGGCRLPLGLRGFVAGVSEGQRPSEWQGPTRRAKVRPHAGLETARHEAPMDAAAQTSTPTPLAAPVAPVATVGVPAGPSADDLARIAHGAGGGLTGVVMALLALAGGGGALWKYLQSKQRAATKRDEQEHAERMKELEIQRSAQQQRNDDHHRACDTARAVLVGRVDSLESQGRMAEQMLSNLRDRLDALSGRIDSGNAITDQYTTMLNKRLTKLETAVKKKGAK